VPRPGRSVKTLSRVPLQPPSASAKISPPFWPRMCRLPRPGEIKGQFSLDSFDRLMKAGESKSAPVVPGQPEQSELVRRLTHGRRRPHAAKGRPVTHRTHCASSNAWDQRRRENSTAPDPKAPLVTLFRERRIPTRRGLSASGGRTALAFNPNRERAGSRGYHEITIWNPSDGTLLAPDQKRRAADPQHRLQPGRRVAGRRRRFALDSWARSHCSIRRTARS